MRNSHSAIPQEEKKEKGKRKWDIFLRFFTCFMVIGFIQYSSWTVESPYTMVAFCTLLIKTAVMPSLTFGPWYMYLLMGCIALITGPLQAHFAYRILLAFPDYQVQLERKLEKRRVLRWVYTLQKNGYENLVRFKDGNSALFFLFSVVTIPAIVVHLIVAFGVLVSSYAMAVQFDSGWVFLVSLIVLLHGLPVLFLYTERLRNDMKNTIEGLPMNLQYIGTFALFLFILYGINLLSPHLG